MHQRYLSKSRTTVEPIVVAVCTRGHRSAWLWLATKRLAQSGQSAQFNQTTQALWAGYVLRWWFGPPGPCTGFNRAERDATKWCDGVIDGIACGQRPATASPQGYELPSGTFNDFTHRYDISWAPESAAMAMCH